MKIEKAVAAVPEPKAKGGKPPSPKTVAILDAAQANGDLWTPVVCATLQELNSLGQTLRRHNFTVKQRGLTVYTRRNGTQ